MLGKAWIVEVYQTDCGTAADDLLRHVLIGRGITDVEKDDFLNPCIRNMPDPFVLKDMERAVNVIADSIVSGDKITIYGDYDVDGITSTAVFVKYLKQIGVNCSWHVPNRDTEGYGLNNAAMKCIADSGTKLLITVDCGISGVKEVEYAHALGMRVVVTDHHSQDVEIPDADAVVNPKRNDDTSGLVYLAGVGVAFLTLIALNRELKKRDLPDGFAKKVNDVDLRNYLDLVALGTICDTMPLVKLNRAFVSVGLKVMNLQKNLGLKELMQVAQIKKSSVYASGFALGPRLNAAGRLDSASPALDLLLTDNVLIAQDLANQLHKMNQDRIDIQNNIMNQADEIAKREHAAGRCSLFVCGDDWHGGVMGIIAGRLKDKYNLPTCVATKKDGVINGSGRSVHGVDLGTIIHDALSKNIVSEGGGHAAAAGFSLPAEKEQEFRDFLEKSVFEQLNGTIPAQEIFVDAELDASGANMELIEKLNALEPFGQGNPEPTLVLRGTRLKYATRMGNGDHIRGCFITSNGNRLSFVGFNLAGTPVGDFLLDDANINTSIKVLGKLKANEYNGRVTAQLFLEDMAL